MPTLRDLATALEAWAPPGSAQDYDNVGLQVGDANRSVDTVLIALDATPQVAEEAVEQGADAILTHHPLLFRPLKQVTTGDYVSELALKLAQSDVALYSIHTNLDAAPGGVSFALAERLGVSDVDVLEGFEDAMYKLATFVPRDAFEPVRAALADAGAGRIGAYDSCAFTTDGTGYFRPGNDTNPHIGEAGGDLESVSERKLEVEVPRWDVGAVLAALHDAHPYEEVAYDVYPVKQKSTRGLGAIGTVDPALSLSDFLERVATQLDAGSLRYVGDEDASIETVAVCGGAGSDLMGTARRAGADAYVTADITYHTFFNALTPEGTPAMAVIDPGHYETEALTEELLCDWLAERFSDVTFRTTTQRTSPMQHYIPPSA